MVLLVGVHELFGRNLGKTQSHIITAVRKEKKQPREKETISALDEVVDRRRVILLPCVCQANFLASRLGVESIL